MLAVGQPVGDALAKATVLDATGASAELGHLWATRDAIVVFVRHFACAGCAEHVAELRPRLDELATFGVGVALVGNGSPAQLAAFVERERLGGHAIETFTDPTLAAYRAADLERSWSGTIGPRAIGNLIGLLNRGYINGRTRGDLVQQGGTLYIRRGGELAMHHRSARVGDHVRVGDVVRIAVAALP